MEKAPVNLLLGDVDGLYHHHCGIGAVDWSVLEGPEETRNDRVIKELHRLETAQANLLLDSLGNVGPEDYLLDAGCGRGGSSIMANQRFGCFVDGVSISEQQVSFANGQAAERGVSDKVKYHFRSMLDTKFETGSRRAIWNNESTMYVDLMELFAEHSRQHLFSVAKDAAESKPVCNMVLQISKDRGCSIQEETEITVKLHNDLVREFEAGCKSLRAIPSLELQRFLHGLRSWMGGGFEWHATNPRYKTKPQPQK